MSFLQSPEWEEFQKSVGRKTWRVDGVLIIRHDLPGGFNYLYCPRPKPVTGNWLPELENVVNEEKSIFLKIDPVKSYETRSHKIYEADSVQPRKTVVLDLQKSEEGLLAAMHEKTRYNIRLAERHGVRVGQRLASLKRERSGPTINDQRPIEIFWGMLQKTAGRDSFHTHERGYYEKLPQAKSENFSNELFFAEHQGRVLAAALVNFYRPAGAATYLHGASSRERKETMAPHLLHWRIIQEAKKRGFWHYDLWGIDEKRWPGLTRFKLGFGGKVIEYPQSIDIVFRPLWYKIYKLLRKILSRALY